MNEQQQIAQMYASYKSTIKTYYFRVNHPVTNEIKMVRVAAVNDEMAKKTLVIMCGKVILNKIISVKVA